MDYRNKEMNYLKAISISAIICIISFNAAATEEQPMRSQLAEQEMELMLIQQYTLTAEEGEVGPESEPVKCSPYPSCDLN